MPSLADKLKSMGVHFGTGDISKPLIIRSIPIENVVQGNYEETEFGEIFISASLFPLDHPHGNVNLNANFDPVRIFEWAKIRGSLKHSPLSAVFIDTETTGLAGGTGTFAFMAGMGFFDEDGFQLRQVFMRDPGEEKAMLVYIEKLLARFSLIVSFNGKGFDIPILKTRFNLNLMPDPFSDHAHVDVLHLARRIWKMRLPNRSLKELETQILDFERTGEDIPGWLVPQLYVDYLRSQDANPLKGVFYHNAMDIVSLAALYKHLAEFMQDPLTFESRKSLDMVALAKLYKEFDHIEEAVDLYSAGIDAGLPNDYIAVTLSQFGHLFRQRKNWPEAIRVWEKAVDHGHIPSAIELAKVYEHRLTQYDKAKIWTRKCQQMVELSDLRKFEKHKLNKELEKRLDRLNQKINHSIKNYG